LDYLKPGSPDFVIVNPGENTDIRQVVIDQLKNGLKVSGDDSRN